MSDDLMCFSTVNDPTKWEVNDGIMFASPEEAKRAEVILNRMMRESFENGRKVAIEESARVCDLLAGLSVQGWGRKCTSAAKKCATEIRALKHSSPAAGDEGKE